MNTYLLGLHVPDDATRDREPGPTVADPMTGTGALTAVLAVAANGAPRLRAGHALPPLPNPIRALVAWASRALRELRAVRGFVFGLVALFVGAIVLLVYWYVYRVRRGRH